MSKSSIQSNCTLVNVVRKAPGGKRTYREESNTFAASKNVSDVKRVTIVVDVFGTPELKEYKSVQGKFYNWAREVTAPWADSGQRLLPNSLGAKFEEREREFCDEADKLKGAAIESIVNLVERDRVELGDLFVEDRYPSRGELEEALSLKVEYAPVPDVDDIRINASKDQVLRIKRQVAEQERERTDAALVHSVTRLHVAIKHTIDKLSNYDGGRKGSFKGEGVVEDLIELASLVGAVNVNADPVLAKAQHDLEKGFAKITAQQLRDDPALREEKAKDAKNILEGLGGFGARA
tara:strand:- start:1327 stop:2205 length:879 start_codon:yes stop_codon:yes gene_type:complete